MNGSLSLRKKKTDILDVRMEKKNRIRKKDNLSTINNKIISFQNVNEKQYSIKPIMLNIKDPQLLSFRIKIDNIKSSIEIIKPLLTNTDINHIKYGIFLINKFFKTLLSNNNTLFDITPFLSIDIFTIYKNILINNLDDYSLIFEVLVSLINISNYPCEINNDKFSYYSLLLSEDYCSIYDYLISNESTPSEILSMLYSLLHNLCIESESSRIIIKQHKYFSKSVTLLVKGTINNYVTRNIYNFLSKLMIDYETMSLDDANRYFNFFQTPLTMESFCDEVILINCLFALGYLSHIKVHAFLINFVVSKVTNRIIEILNCRINSIDDEINLYGLKVITNLIISQKEIIIQNLVDIGIIDLYEKYLTMIKCDTSYSLVLVKEILISIGNLANFDYNLLIQIISNDNIMKYVILYCDSNELSVKTKAFEVVSILFDFGNETVLLKHEQYLPMIIEHLKKEKDRNILSILVDILNAMLYIENNFKVNKSKRYSIQNGIEDILTRKEIVDLENVPTLKEFLNNV